MGCPILGHDYYGEQRRYCADSVPRLLREIPLEGRSSAEIARDVVDAVFGARSNLLVWEHSDLARLRLVQSSKRRPSSSRSVPSPAALDPEMSPV